MGTTTHPRRGGLSVVGVGNDPPTSFFSPPLPGEFEEESKQPPMTEQQRHQLKHRELFLSRQFESLPATHIRCGASGGAFSFFSLCLPHF